MGSTSGIDLTQELDEVLGPMLRLAARDHFDLWPHGGPPVVKGPASTETGEAAPARVRGWQGATTENIGPYLKEEQRSQRGCIAGRMPAGFSPRAARSHTRSSQVRGGGAGTWPRRQPIPNSVSIAAGVRA